MNFPNLIEFLDRSALIARESAESHAVIVRFYRDGIEQPGLLVTEPKDAEKIAKEWVTFANVREWQQLLK